MSAKKKYKIIFAAKDKGGFDAILPVIRKLKINSKFKLFILLDNPAYLFAKKEKIKPFFAGNKPSREIESLIKKIDPDIILTGTSRGFSIEKKIINIAKKLSKISLSVVDCRGNYQERFGKKLEFLPDYVLALDQNMKEDIERQGVLKSRIIVAGNPRFDKFLNIKKSKESKNLIVFYSQPFSEIRYNRLNEIEIFKDVVEVIEKKYPDKKIIVKLHPAEKKYKKFNKTIKNTKLNIIIEKKLDPDILSKKAELIIGMNSVVLFDAVLMGKRVLSYCPGGRKQENSIKDFLEKENFVCDKSEFSQKLEKIYTKSALRPQNFKEYLNRKSTDKVINFMEKILKAKKIVCVIQARMGSSRLPGKVMFDLLGKPVLLHVVDRVLDAKKLDHIIVATTTKKRDDAIVKLIKGYHPNVSIFRGPEMDLLDRYYKAVEKYKPRIIVRITADCPLIDPEIIDKVTEAAIKLKADYVSNTLNKRTYPRGLDVDAFSFGLLKELQENVIWNLDREHVILFARRNPSLFKCKTIINKKDYSSYRITLDEKDDYRLIKKIYQKIYPHNPDFRMKDIINLFEKEPKLTKINQHVEQKNPHF